MAEISEKAAPPARWSWPRARGSWAPQNPRAGEGKIVDSVDVPVGADEGFNGPFISHVSGMSLAGQRWCFSVSLSLSKSATAGSTLSMNFSTFLIEDSHSDVHENRKGVEKLGRMTVVAQAAPSPPWPAVKRILRASQKKPSRPSQIVLYSKEARLFLARARRLPPGMLAWYAWWPCR